MTSLSVRCCACSLRGTAPPPSRRHVHVRQAPGHRSRATLSIISRVSKDGGESGGDGLGGWLMKGLSAFKLDDQGEETVGPEVAFITADKVWDVELAVYERSPTTPISTKTAARTSTLSLAFSCSFDPADKGYYPPRGQAEVEGSRFFAGGKGAYWIADEPGIFKFTLNNMQSVKSGDTEVLPEGRVFFNARIRPDMGEVPGCSLVDGVATVKQDVKASFMGQDYSGILAEYIVVGSFTAALQRE